LPARRSLLLVASLVPVLGWTFTPRSVNEPPVILDSRAEFLAFFQPQTSALTFGFLGAYSYTLLTVFRSSGTTERRDNPLTEQFIPSNQTNLQEAAEGGRYLLGFWSMTRLPRRADTPAKKGANR
jgi:hypothetical protein